MSKVLVERIKHPKYEIRWRNYNGEIERHIFPQYNAKTKAKRVAEITEECYYWLLDETRCFQNGSLVVVDTKEQKSKIEEVLDKDGYSQNAHTKEDMTKILKGSEKKMREELSKITDQMEKQFVIDTYKELGLDSSKKEQAIVEVLFGEDVPVDTIF